MYCYLINFEKLNEFYKGDKIKLNFNCVVFLIDNGFIIKVYIFFIGIIWILKKEICILIIYEYLNMLFYCFYFII